MATIASSCPTCGKVRFPHVYLKVIFCIDTNSGQYIFNCPKCGCMISKDASNTTLDTLIAGGVQIYKWRIPEEMLEAHSGPVISIDDIIDLHDGLVDDYALQKELDGLTDDPC